MPASGVRIELLDDASAASVDPWAAAAQRPAARAADLPALLVRLRAVGSYL